MQGIPVWYSITFEHKYIQDVGILAYWECINHHIISYVSRAQMISFHDDIKKNSTHNSKYVRASSSQPPTLQKCSYVLSFFIHRCCSCVTILFSGSWPLQYQMGLPHFTHNIVGCTMNLNYRSVYNKWVATNMFGFYFNNTSDLLCAATLGLVRIVYTHIIQI